MALGILHFTQHKTQNPLYHLKTAEDIICIVLTESLNPFPPHQQLPPPPH